jgi:hypothetical protein
MSITQPPASPARTRTAATRRGMAKSAVTRPSTARLAAAQPSPADVRCTALFASGLQASDTLAPDAVAAAIMHTLRRLGRHGCAGLMAQEFGDHPETAGARMRWARQVVAGTPAAQPA